MRGHKVCFNGKIRKIIPKLSLLPLLIWSTVKAAKTKTTEFENLTDPDEVDQACFQL